MLFDIICEDRESGLKCSFKGVEGELDADAMSSRIEDESNDLRVNALKLIENNESLRSFLLNCMIMLPQQPDLDEMIGLYPSEEFCHQTLPVAIQQFQDDSTMNYYLTIKYQKIHQKSSHIQTMTSSSSSSSSTTPNECCFTIEGTPQTPHFFTGPPSTTIERGTWAKASGQEKAIMPFEQTSLNNSQEKNSDVPKQRKSGQTRDKVSSFSSSSSSEIFDNATVSPEDFSVKGNLIDPIAAVITDQLLATTKLREEKQKASRPDKSLIISEKNHISATISPTAAVENANQTMTDNLKLEEEPAEQEASEVLSQSPGNNEDDDIPSGQAGEDQLSSSSSSQHTSLNQQPEIKKSQSALTNELISSEQGSGAAASSSLSHRLFGQNGTSFSAYQPLVVAPNVSVATSTAAASATFGKFSSQDILGSPISAQKLNEGNTNNNYTEGVVANTLGLVSINSGSRQSRNKERTIMEAIDMVTRWRDLQEQYRQKHQVKGLQEVADELNISKKVLDYYFQELRTAEFFGFDFDGNLGKKMGVLRKFIDEQKKNHEGTNKNFKITRNLQFRYRLRDDLSYLIQNNKLQEAMALMTNSKDVQKQKHTKQQAKLNKVENAINWSCLVEEEEEEGEEENDENNDDDAERIGSFEMPSYKMNAPPVGQTGGVSAINDILLRNSPNFFQFLNHTQKTAAANQSGKSISTLGNLLGARHNLMSSGSEERKAISNLTKKKVKQEESGKSAATAAVAGGPPSVVEDLLLELLSAIQSNQHQPQQPAIGEETASSKNSSTGVDLSLLKFFVNNSPSLTSGLQTKQQQNCITGTGEQSLGRSLVVQNEGAMMTGLKSVKTTEVIKIPKQDL